MSQFILALLALLLSTNPQDQTNGTIRGTVKSRDTNALLPNSRLYFYSSRTETRSRLIETKSGKFTVIGAPPGEYSCFASHDGYRPIVVNHVRVRAGSVTELELVLEMSSASTDTTYILVPGTPGLDYRMKFYTPDIKKYR